MFSKDRDNVWVCAGYTDLNNLPSASAKHERSSAHIQHQIALKMVVKCTPINLALDEASRQEVSVHNAKVWENREILKDFIRATCYLARQELAFRGNGETTESSNGGNYVELLNTFAEKDERLKMHLETSSVFSGTSNRIQNDLILAVNDIVYALFSVLQNKSLDIAFCCQRISDTMAVMGRLRQDFDSFYVKFEERCQQLGLSDASARGDQPIRDRRRLLFYSILENICTQMKTRFDHYGKLSFIGLVDTRKFKHIKKF
ncbi:hypothetical protein ACEWY4_025554 [Coilia grayii]|uniref:Uncharacterized protein n=1 Tax=Coilia grayii TaxID=363190 RepID=A0ABD1IZV6_9TELE